MLAWAAEKPLRLAVFQGHELENFFMTKIVEIYKQVFSMLQKNPTVLFLFLILGIFDAIALTILFFAPIPPVSYVLAPIIRTFWTDQFLHYPYNFLLLPKLFGHAHFLISTVIGVFISGLIIKKIEADTKGETISTLFAFGFVLKKYISLVVAWLISYGVFTVGLKGLLYLLPKNLLIQMAGGFVLALLIQSIFAFLLPSLIIVDQGFLRSFLEGLRCGLKNVGIMSAIFAVPMLLVFAASFAKLYTSLFVQIYPELVLWVLAGGIVITLVVDILITSSATLMFLKVRNKKS